jgi:hypothetical protein
LVFIITAPVFDLHHPFHLHGYDFFVMAMDQFRNGETLESISRKLLETNFRRSSLPARKDTITVPSNGYAAFRFRADNPGESLFCMLTGYGDPRAGGKVVKRKIAVPAGSSSLYLQHWGTILSQLHPVHTPPHTNALLN